MGLKMGFTTKDLQFMSPARLRFFMRGYNELYADDEDENNDVRQATQADIDMYL